jgi:predicted PurR-regulated permease PerM
MMQRVTAQPAELGRVLNIAATTIVVFAGMALAAPIVGWVLLSVFFAILCRPLYEWLMARGLSGAVALTIVGLALTGIVVLLAGLVGASVAGLVANMATYRALLAERAADVRALLDGLGIALPAELLADVLNPGAVVGWMVWFVGAISSAAFSFVYTLLLVLFLLADGPAMAARVRRGLGDDHPLVMRLASVGPNVVRFFGIRAYVNLLTGAGVAVALWLLGIDYAVLWGVLLFFMSFVPYIGIFVASAPPVVLALAEYGVGRALLVIVGITIVNAALENVVMPRMVGTSLRLAPTVVLVSFFFWTWLLGATGALLAVFLTLLLIVILDSYPGTRWLATLMAGADDDAGESSAETTASIPVPATRPEA